MCALHIYMCVGYLSCVLRFYKVNSKYKYKHSIKCNQIYLFLLLYTMLWQIRLRSCPFTVSTDCFFQLCGRAKRVSTSQSDLGQRKQRLIVYFPFVYDDVLSVLMMCIMLIVCLCVYLCTAELHKHFNLSVRV